VLPWFHTLPVPACCIAALEHPERLVQKSRIKAMTSCLMPENDLTSEGQADHKGRDREHGLAEAGHLVDLSRSSGYDPEIINGLV